jgi:hypothetical protein
LKTERRAVARYRTKLAVQIDMDDHKIDAKSMEISLHGLRVVCEGSSANKIFNKYIQVTPGENITANIQIKIPKQRDVLDTVNCLSRVISVNRISQSRYLVGFNIVNCDSEGQKLWKDYISTKR